MGTAKRERQKANRQLRLQVQEKQAKRDRTKKRLLRYTLLAAGFVVLVVLAVVLFGGDDEETTTSAGTATNAPTTTAAPLQPVSTTPGATLGADYPCPAADGTSARAVSFGKAPQMCIDPAKTYKALVETSKGNYTITFDAKKAPQAVNNFVVLARYHYFDGVQCHRIIKGFVVQCGDPTGTGTGVDSTGKKYPGYTFNDELPAAGEYKEGSIAMANAGPNTNGSQFFIITGAQGVALPPSYSLFGQVTEGYETTVKALEAAANPDGTDRPKEVVWMQKVTITES